MEHLDFISKLFRQLEWRPWWEFDPIRQPKGTNWKGFYLFRSMAALTYTSGSLLVPGFANCSRLGPVGSDMSEKSECYDFHPSSQASSSLPSLILTFPQTPLTCFAYKCSSKQPSCLDCHVKRPHAQQINAFSSGWLSPNLAKSQICTSRNKQILWKT